MPSVQSSQTYDSTCKQSSCAEMLGLNGLHRDGLHRHGMYSRGLHSHGLYIYGHRRVNDPRVVQCTEALVGLDALWCDDRPTQGKMHMGIWSKFFFSASFWSAFILVRSPQEIKVV